MTEYVDCLSNPNYIENLYKIGFTNNPLKRAEELYSTGVPSDFEIEFIIQTTDGNLLEQMIHTKLIDYRNNSHREFFRISMTTLKNILENEMKLSLITDVKTYLDINDTSAKEPKKEEKLFVCEKCSNKFKTKQNLQKHNKNQVCLKKEEGYVINFNEKQQYILLSIEKLKKELVITNAAITAKIELLETMLLNDS